MTVAIKENLNVSQPNGFSGGQTDVVPDSDIEVSEEQGKMFKFEPGLTLALPVEALELAGTAFGFRCR